MVRRNDVFPTGIEYGAGSSCLWHMVVNDCADSLCDCGLRGCLEAQTAGPAITRQGRLAVASGMSFFG